MTTDEYFRKRALKKVNYSEKVANEILKRSIPIYEQTLRNVQGELDKLYSQLIDDSDLLNKNILTEKLYGLERKIALREFTAQLEKKGINISEVYGKDFLRKLTRLSILEEKVYWEIKSIRNSILSLQNKGYKNIIENTYRTTMGDLRGELQNGDSNLLLSSSPATISKDIVKEIAQSEWIGGNYKIRFEGNIESFARRTKEIIGGGLSVGWSLEKIQKSIRDEFQTSRYETARLVRTESAYFLGQADLASYVEDGVVDYRYLATLDRRTSKICRSLDGKVFKVKDAVVGKNYPPMHPNCRSGTIPVLETMVDPETGKPLGISNVETNNERFARDYITEERYYTGARTYKVYLQEQRLKHDTHTSVAQGESLNNQPVLDTFEKQLEYIVKKQDFLAGSTEKEKFEYLSQEFGYNAKPKILNRSEFANLDEDKYIKVYRGLSSDNQNTAKEYANQFKMGDGKLGIGDISYGAGYYTSEVKAHAETYGNYIIEIAIPKSAKIIDYEELLEIQRFDNHHYAQPSDLERYYKKYGEKVNDILPDLLSYSNSSLFAIFHGYDIVKRGAIYLILNRGIIYVKD